MTVSDLEAVCRSEAQRVLTCLRGNRKFGNLHRSWRDLEEESPIRKLAEWRSDQEAVPVALLQTLLLIVRSPDFAGPSTYASLEAVQALLSALSEASEPGLAGNLVEVCNAVCECVFEETNAQVDEATAMQMITVLSLCATSPAGAEQVAFPGALRLKAFDKVLSLWGHYRHSLALRSSAQVALQRMLDFACADLPAQANFLGQVLGRMISEVGPSFPTDRVLLYLRCLQRLMTHPVARQLAVADGPMSSFFQDSVPLTLLAIGDHFCNSISVLSLLLPLVNRTCWLCVDHWSTSQPPGVEPRHTPCLGSLQVESLMGSIYLRSLSRAVAPLKATEGTAGLGLTAEEGAELLAILLEGLCDLLRSDTVRTLWISFDADWRRPPLLQQVVDHLALLLLDAPSTERPLPAHLVHLSSTVLSRIVGAFAAVGANCSHNEAEHTRVKEQWQRRQAVLDFIEKFEESPKKARQVLEKSGILDFVPLPPPLPNTVRDPPHQDWALKLAWILRCLNHCVPYSAMGELFGQPFGKTEPKDTQLASGAFVDTFNWGPADIDEALRSFLQSFLLPKEGQQIERVLETFANCYYRKHMDYASANGIPNSTYLKNPDAAHTLAFSIIMLNTDQHNPKVTKRMTLENFLSNNRGINGGENIPEKVQVRIFDSIRGNEIKTPSSGKLSEGVSLARWVDFMQLIRQGFRSNELACLNPDHHGPELAAHAQVFLERTGEKLRSALEHALAMDAGANSDALAGLEHLLRLTVHCRRPEADSVAEGLFFFGTEVFHEPAQQRATVGRAAACLRALFRTSLARLTNMSTKQLHMMVYLTAQFALYGLFDRALPAPDPITSRLLRSPSLVVDPPTGVVYSFLRKISTAPFKMLSYAEEGTGDAKAKGPDGSPQNRSSTGAPSSSPRNSVSEDTDGASQGPAVPPSPRVPGITALSTSEEVPRVGADDTSAKVQDASPPPEDSAADEASLQDDPLRPQIEKAFKACDLDSFVRALVQLWQPCEGQPDTDADEGHTLSANIQDPEAAQTFLAYLSPLFLALRTAGAGKVGKDQDLPWWPEPPAFTCMSTPQALVLPKRALSLNVLDGYEILRLALRLMTATLGSETASTPHREHGYCPNQPSWQPAAVQELSVCCHIGLFHTLRRGDLSERTLRVAIAGLFQAGSVLLSSRTAEGHVVSMGWPVRLISELLRRTEGEPQLLIPTARLCLEAVRAFVAEVSRSRPLDRLELWKALLLLLLKATPTPARALWPGTKDREVEGIQGQLWRQGAVWLLAHPHLLLCLGPEGGSAATGTTGTPSVSTGDRTSAGSPGGSTSTTERGTATSTGEGGGGFWAWALGELAALAQEIAAGSRPTAARLLLEAYATLLGNIARVQSPEDYAALDEDLMEPPPASLVLGGLEPLVAGSPCSSGTNGFHHHLAADERSSAWSRVAMSLLSYIGPSLGKPNIDETELQPVPLLKQVMLNVRVPPLLSASAQGPYWARLTLEKLVSSLTGVVSSGAPLPVVREAVSLVAKFFLQNLHTLQRHECFGQLWLMVLRLMLLFIKRGTDDRDTELEEIATETLKNLLCVLLSTRSLGFVSPKGAGQKEEEPAPGGEVKIWWQMTWDCIEVFLPGFGEDFARAMLPDDDRPALAEAAAVAMGPPAEEGRTPPQQLDVPPQEPPSATPEPPAPDPVEDRTVELQTEEALPVLPMTMDQTTIPLATQGSQQEGCLLAGQGHLQDGEEVGATAGQEIPAFTALVTDQHAAGASDVTGEVPQTAEGTQGEESLPAVLPPGAKVQPQALRATQPTPRGGDEVGTAGAELAAVLARRRRASEAAEEKPTTDEDKSTGDKANIATEDEACTAAGADD